MSLVRSLAKVPRLSPRPLSLTVSRPARLQTRFFTPSTRLHDAEINGPDSVTAANGTKPPTFRSRLLRGSLYLAALVGFSVGIVGLGVCGFFIYDASTYKDEVDFNEVTVSPLALNPRRGGPKGLPIADDLIDDDESPHKSTLKHKPRLVILGGGWGSVALLKELDPEEYHVTVISPANYFLFTPMLPSATVGTLGLQSLVESIRRILHRVGGHFIRARAEDIEFHDRLVEVSQEDPNGKDGRRHFYVPYDKLVVAVGSVTNQRGVEGLEHAHFLKDINDARHIRNRITRNVEMACLPSTTDEERKRLLSFVICGGGPTGVEFAAEIYDLLNEDLTRYFPKVLRNEVSVHLIQSRNHILNTYDESLSNYAEDRFARDQVQVMTNSRVQKLEKDRIVFTQKDSDGTLVTKELPMGFCLWSTGVAQTEFSQRVAKKLGPAAQSNRNALSTDTHLRLLGTPTGGGDVYAIGDCATVQNNITDHVLEFLGHLSRKHGKNPETAQLHFDEWRRVAADVKKQFPQASMHLKHLDQLFTEHDRDRSGTLDFDELRTLLLAIDSKLTSLPATAQRAHQQGQYLARKFNRLARYAASLPASAVISSSHPTSGLPSASEATSALTVPPPPIPVRDYDELVYRAFKYKHLGSLAYIGNSAVFDLGQGWNFAGGLWGVYAWRSVYFAQSVSPRTRILLAMDWAKRGLFGRDMISY